MLKKVFTIIAGAAAVCTIAGCSAGTTQQETTTATIEETTTQDAGLESSRDVANSFLKCIDNGDYAGALKYCTDSMKTTLNWENMISEASDSLVEDLAEDVDIVLSEDGKTVIADYFVKLLDAAVEKAEITDVAKDSDDIYKVSFELTQYDFDDDASTSGDEYFEDIVNEYYSANQEELDGYVRAGDMDTFYNQLFVYAFPAYGDKLAESVIASEPETETYWLKVSKTGEEYQVSDIDMNFKLIRAILDSAV